jgi:hypothetical protein
MRVNERTVDELSLAETNAIIEELERRLSSWLLEDDTDSDVKFVPDTLPRVRSELSFDEIEESS